MAALIGIRRWEGMTPDAAPPGTGTMYQPMERWVIRGLLGLVVRVVLLPPGSLPVLGLGETSLLSLTLQVGDPA